jgi:hypothetical protein
MPNVIISLKWYLWGFVLSSVIFNVTAFLNPFVMHYFQFPNLIEMTSWFFRLFIMCYFFGAYYLSREVNWVGKLLLLSTSLILMINTFLIIIIDLNLIDFILSGAALEQYQATFKVQIEGFVINTLVSISYLTEGMLLLLGLYYLLVFCKKNENITRETHSRHSKLEGS